MFTPIVADTKSNSDPKINTTLFETNRTAKFNQSRQIPVEITPRYSYEDSTTYFSVTYNLFSLGYFHRDPWFETWIAFSEITGEQKEFDTQAAALTYLTAAYAEKFC